MEKLHELRYRYYLGNKKTAGDSPIMVTLIGVGGNGSNVLTDLARMHYVLRKLGHPGLEVTAYDADKVTPANCGRQLFAPCEVGLNKAISMMTRINNFFGLSWEGYACNFDQRIWKDFLHASPASYQIVISCVDSAKTRIDLNKTIRNSDTILWLDIGNTKSSGQGIIGSFGYRDQPTIEGINTVNRLPTVIDLYPDIAEHDSGQEATPSCSVEEALSRQDLFINKAVSTISMKILFDGIVQGYFDIHGVFINIENMQMSSLMVSPEVWEKMGYSYKIEQDAFEFIRFLREKNIPVEKALEFIKNERE